MEELSKLERVQDALDMLDADDQEHWTTEDLPRVDVVSGLSGVTDLTRETLTLMYPDFVRYPVVADNEESSVEEVEEEEVLSRETMEGMIAELTERASVVSQERADILIQINELNYQADALRDKMQINFPPPSAAEVQRRYAQMHVERSRVASQQNAAVIAAAEKVMNAPPG